jgi:hypothetical protein
MTISRTFDGMRMAMYGAFAIFALGCGGPTEPSDVVVIPTAGAFSVDEHATFVVRNEGRETIYLARCGERVQAGVDRRVGLRWQNEMAGLCILSLYVPPLQLEPGESVTDSVLMRSPGTFRVFVGYGRGDDRILYNAWSRGFRVD